MRKRPSNRWIAVILLCGILILAIASIVKPDISYSEEENRMLTQAPMFSPERVMEKEYMEDLEDYTEDQFLLRDLWISLKVQSDLIMGKREFNGVYLGKEKYLIQNLSAPDQTHVDENIAQMNAFADRNSNLRVNAMLVPNAAYIMEDYLPEGAPVRNQEEDMKNLQESLSSEIGFVDISAELKKHVGEGLYYKTDHHWTSKGAYYGFQAAASQLEISDPKTEYETYTVTCDFSGTLAARSGYHRAEDAIEIYAPKDDETAYLISDSDNAEERPSLYEQEALQEKDKYQVFFGGNHAMVDIVTANDTKKKLLVFKDSYANCFVPFLLPYYNEIIMIDPRYYYDNVQTLITNHSITDVLFLYNVDTFLTDRSLADVLATE